MSEGSSGPRGDAVLSVSANGNVPFYMSAKHALREPRVRREFEGWRGCGIPLLQVEQFIADSAY